MYIQVKYKEPAELSLGARRASVSDQAEEKMLLVNPDCYVRVLAEYIRRKCNLGEFTTFDLCDEHGTLKYLFEMEPFEYGTKLFKNGWLYYIIVLRPEKDKSTTVLPQLKWEDPFYLQLKEKVWKCLLGERSSGCSAVAQSGKSAGNQSPRSPTKSKKNISPRK